MSQPIARLLDGYVLKEVFAKANDLGVRTVERYISLPNGLPHLEWGGKTYIPIEPAREWITARIKRNNPTRKRAA